MDGSIFRPRCIAGKFEALNCPNGPLDAKVGDPTLQSVGCSGGVKGYSGKKLFPTKLVWLIFGFISVWG